MGKKITVMFFVASCVMFLIVGAKFIRDTGLLRKFPEPHYFSEEEERLRPVYSQLSEKEKAVYHALYEGMKERRQKIELPYEINGDTYSKLYCLVEKQEESLFYADSTYYTAERVRDASILYREDDEKIVPKLAELEKAKNKAMVYISPDGDNYSTALKIHDYIVRNCRYITGEDVLYSSTVYGCLVEGEANCEGYAKTFDLLASECGLRSVLVTGVTDSGENHAWNQVEINGVWYDLDVTWDDTDIEGDKRRNYFLCSDADFGRTHTADTQYYTPFECKGGDDEYYVKSGSYAESLEEAEKIIRSGIAEGREFIEIKFADSTIYSKFKMRYLEQRHIFDLLEDDNGAYPANASISVRENETERCIALILNG